MMHLARSFRDVFAGAPSVCCIGAFDGVHLGHQHLIRAAVREARECGMRSAVVTFFPHPRAVLGRVEERYLTLPDEKAEYVEKLGVDVLLVHEFTTQTIHTRAEEFVRMMMDAFDMRSLWAGPDFAFGYRREGTVDWLHSVSERFGFEMHVAEPLLLDERPVSSSRIRAALGQGDMSEVARCLGRPYAVRGIAGSTGEEVQLDGRKWLPTAGTYPVRVGGADNFLTLTDAGAPARLHRKRIAEEFSRIVVDFL